MHMELPGSLRNIEVVLEETIDHGGRLFVKAFRYITAENLFQEIFAQGNRKLIDQSSDAQFIIGEYGLLGVEQFSHFKRQACFAESARKLGKIMDH